MSQQVKIPEWVVGYPVEDRAFVIHLHWPRFVAEVNDDGDVELIIWWDTTEEIIQLELAAGRNPTCTFIRLIQEATDVYLDELSLADD